METDKAGILNSVDNVESCKGLMSSFLQWCYHFSNAWLIRSKGTFFRGRVPDLVAVEGCRIRLVVVSLLLWQWESWVLNMPLPF